MFADFELDGLGAALVLPARRVRAGLDRFLLANSKEEAPRIRSVDKFVGRWGRAPGCLCARGTPPSPRQLHAWQLAEELTVRGHEAAPRTVTRLLKQTGYSLQGNT